MHETSIGMGIGTLFVTCILQIEQYSEPHQLAEWIPVGDRGNRKDLQGSPTNDDVGLTILK